MSAPSEGQRRAEALFLFPAEAQGAHARGKHRQGNNLNTQPASRYPSAWKWWRAGEGATCDEHASRCTHAGNAAKSLSAEFVSNSSPNESIPRFLLHFDIKPETQAALNVIDFEYLTEYFLSLE